jgi:hypothetical protein
MNVVRLSALHICGLYPQGKITGTRFCYTLSWPQGHSAAGRIKSMQIVKDTIGNRTRDLPACSTVPPPTALPHVPFTTWAVSCLSRKGCKFLSSTSKDICWYFAIFCQLRKLLHVAQKSCSYYRSGWQRTSLVLSYSADRRVREYCYVRRHFMEFTLCVHGSTVALKWDFLSLFSALEYKAQCLELSIVVIRLLDLVRSTGLNRKSGNRGSAPHTAKRFLSFSKISTMTKTLNVLPTE